MPHGERTPTGFAAFPPTWVTTCSAPGVPWWLSEGETCRPRQPVMIFCKLVFFLVGSRDAILYPTIRRYFFSFSAAAVCRFLLLFLSACAHYRSARCIRKTMGGGKKKDMTLGTGRDPENGRHASFFEGDWPLIYTSRAVGPRKSVAGRHFGSVFGMLVQVATATRWRVCRPASRAALLNIRSFFFFHPRFSSVIFHYKYIPLPPPTPSTILLCIFASFQFATSILLDDRHPIFLFH